MPYYSETLFNAKERDIDRALPRMTTSTNRITDILHSAWSSSRGLACRVPCDSVYIYCVENLVLTFRERPADTSTAAGDSISSEHVIDENHRFQESACALFVS